MIYSTLLYAVWKEEEEEGEGRPGHLNRSFRTSGRLTPRLDLNRKKKKKKKKLIVYSSANIEMHTILCFKDTYTIR